MALLIGLVNEAELALLKDRAVKVEPLLSAEAAALNFDVVATAEDGRARDAESGDTWVKFWLDVDVVALVPSDD